MVSDGKVMSKVLVFVLVEKKVGIGGDVCINLWNVESIYIGG